MSDRTQLQNDNARLKRDNQRLRQEVSELTAKIAELGARLPKQAKATLETTAERKPYNVYDPAPGDHAFNALRAQHQQKRRSWLE
jgi:cell division septum initiation protein DivIVA